MEQFSKFNRKNGQKGNKIIEINDINQGSLTSKLFCSHIKLTLLTVNLVVK